MTQFPLTEDLYNAVVNTRCLYTRIQFLPQSSEMAVVEDPETNTLEIGLSKFTYLKLFKEGHGFFNGIYPTQKAMSQISDSELHDIYLATLALLVTTNDHTTVWRVHEQVLWELSAKNHDFTAASDFKFCTALATSRLDKINKSSLLWHWLRKLSVHLIFDGDFKSLVFEDFLVQVLRSMDAHYANYAAAFTFVWLLQVARGLDLGFDEKSVVKLFRTQCRQKVGDISMWTCFGQILTGVNSVYAEKSYRHIFQSLQGYSKVFGSDGTCPKWRPRVSDSAFSFLQNEARVELKWLIDVQCTTISPYTHILHSIEDKKSVNELVNTAVENLGSEAGTLSETQKAFKNLLLGLVMEE